MCPLAVIKIKRVRLIDRVGRLKIRRVSESDSCHFSGTRRRLVLSTLFFLFPSQSRERREARQTQLAFACTFACTFARTSPSDSLGQLSLSSTRKPVGAESFRARRERRVERTEKPRSTFSSREPTGHSFLPQTKDRDGADHRCPEAPRFPSRRRESRTTEPARRERVYRSYRAYNLFYFMISKFFSLV